MLYFRSCPHCQTGTVLLDWDQAGSFFECLNCGWMLDTKQPQPAGASTSDTVMGEIETSRAPAASAKAA